MLKSAERVSLDSSDNFVYQRSRLAYHFAAERVEGVEGRIVEIGTGAGYGAAIIAPKSSQYITLDKELPNIDMSTLDPKIEMIAASVPPIPLDNESCDCVVSFQVIEHIERDSEFVSEVYRILKPNGVFVVSTPNASMSLTRNPWHVREYLGDEFHNLLATKFDPHKIEARGVNGGRQVMSYYEKNRAGVERITRFDIFDLQHRLPRWALKIPYDILNRVNRLRLLGENRELTEGITMEDYSVGKITPQSFDLLFVARK